MKRLRPYTLWSVSAFALLVAVSLGWHHRYHGVRMAPGITAPLPPQQTDLEQPRQLTHRGYTLTEVAHFTVDARIMSAARYRFDRHAELSPVDLYVGWARMSDQDVLDQFRFRQGGRWARWHARAIPMDLDEIRRSTANIHIIPADDTVLAQITHLRPGQLIRLQGSLVHVRSDDGWTWRTSTRRDDAGLGGCEIMLVSAVEILPAPTS